MKSRGARAGRAHRASRQGRASAPAAAAQLRPVRLCPARFESLPAGEGAVGGPSISTRVGATLDTFAALEHKRVQLGDLFPDFVIEKESIIEVDPRDGKVLDFLANAHAAHVVTIADGCTLSPIVAYRYLAAQIPAKHPILLKDTFHPPAPGAKPDVLDTMLNAASNIGALLCDGIGDAILVRGEPGPGASVRLAFNILQSVGNRIFKTDYVACPSCGRTLFNLQTTTAKIRESTNHLKGVKIAIMGCIVNGPGEWPTPISATSRRARQGQPLHRQTPVKFNIPKARPSSASSTSSRKTASGSTRPRPSPPPEILTELTELTEFSELTELEFGR